MKKRLIDIREASEYLGIAVNTLRCWCSRKSIPHVKIDRMVRFDVQVLDEWINERIIAPDNDIDKYI